MKKKKVVRPITAEEFDRKFDDGEDISAYVDWSKAFRMVNVSIPIWAIKELDKEATRRGIPRQSLIKHWLVERLDSERGNLAKKAP